jgi:hypothetical protein
MPDTSKPRRRALRLALSVTAAAAVPAASRSAPEPRAADPFLAQLAGR